MIPIRDANPSRRTPVVNYALILVSFLVFFYELQLNEHIEAFIFYFGLVPAKITRPEVASYFTWLERYFPFITSIFLHGGWLHIISNLWVLFIFGDNVESALGHIPYLFFYLVSGLIAGFIHFFTNLPSMVPTIGASGAIAGVMGAYFILYPRAKVLTVIPIFIFLYPLEIPAYVFLGFWFIMQFFNATFSLVAKTGQFIGIAWWAHAGGFLGGILLLYLFRGFRRIRGDVEDVD